MGPTKKRNDGASAGDRTSEQRQRWLLLVHQLPATPSNARVRTWRRIQQLGAIPLKQAAYVLPDSAETREDFEWLKSEIEASGGEASVFAAVSLDARTDGRLIAEFRALREATYEALIKDVRRLLKSRSGKRQRGRADGADRALQGLRERLSAMERIDFFGAPSRGVAESLIAQLEALVAAPSPHRSTGHDGRSVAEFARRTWVTRPRPGVDRMASAWLIRRFIDPQASFGFVTSPPEAGSREIPFDMSGVEFSHRGSECTFETLCAEFGLRQPAVVHLATLVHDLDLKDGRYGPPEAATVGELIEGLQMSYADDHALLVQGVALFEALYRSTAARAR